MSRNSLSANEELRKGDFIVSNNAQWKAVFQDDGNFVIYNNTNGKPTWASGTVNSDVLRLAMQHDCNLCIYTKTNRCIWASNTCQNDCRTVRLQLKDNGHLVIEKDQYNIWEVGK